MRSPLFYILLGLWTFICMLGSRLAFFYINCNELVHNPPMQALWLGAKFDLATLAYWLVIPLILQHIYPRVSEKIKRIYLAITHLYFIASLIFILFITISDIAYYNYYYTHINFSVFLWADSPASVASMLWGVALYRYSLIAILLSITLSILVYRYLHKSFTIKINYSKYFLLQSLSVFLLFFLCMRGGFRSNPLNTKDANYSQNYFFNQLALNPIYNLYKFTFENYIHFYTLNPNAEKNAYSEARAHGSTADTTIFPSFQNSPNIVIILMESMASFKMEHAPFLQSLAKQSIYFTNFYAAGEHTYNGVFSTLFGEPAIMGKHMLRYMEKSTVSGLPGLLHSNGYFTAFNIPHSRNFDNMSSFLWKHNFDSIVDYANLPKHLKGGSVWGTSDHNWLQYSLQNLDFFANKNKPFFNVILTISDHPPYFIPTGDSIPTFSKGNKSDIVAYADWSISKFFSMAKTKKWFSNTIFILLGDHGHFSGKSDFPLPLSFHKIPCIMYMPGKPESAATYSSIACQQDIYPTVANMLNFGNFQTPLAYDLTKENRPFAFFCSDNYCGVLDKQAYLMMSESGENIFENLTGNTANQIKISSMQNYLLSMAAYTAVRLNNFQKR